jgi:hypothetical protein
MAETFAIIGTALGASAGTATTVGIAATSVAVGAVGANVQYQAGQRQAAAQEAAQQEQRRRQNIQALREAQIKRAMLQQQSVSAGTLGSSGYLGGMSSIQSQLGSNIGFGNTMTQLGQQAMAAQQTANKAGSIGGVIQGGLRFAYASEAPVK